jgi:hypothetical protein
MRNAFRLALLSVFFFATTTSAQTVNVTGTWSGQFTITDNCDNGQTFSSNGNASAGFSQSGSSVTGSITMNNAVFTDGSKCIPQQPETFTIVVTGTVSGGSFTGSFVEPEGGRIVPLTGTVTSTSMSLSFPGNPVTSGTFTLSLTSTTPPDSQLTGTYTGTFNAVIIPCGNPPPIAYSGSFTAGLTQTGTAIVGSATVSNSKEEVCDSPGSRTLIDIGPETDLFVGQISGSSISGVVTSPGGDGNSFTATISGDTISGSATGQRPGESFTFTMTRSSTGTPRPGIFNFTASPSAINAGESSTLSWSTINAGIVSIDNGIGTQSPSGIATVSPRQTTTYKLTAIGTAGSTTATATVTVAGAAPARIGVASFPRGMVQATGQSGATDSFALTNFGGTAADITLSPSGNFFTVAPTNFTLAPGTTQIVTVTGTAQPAGFFEGSVTAAAVTVPIRLLSATPPGENAQVAASVSRSDVRSAAGQNPSGSVNFTNRGMRPLPAIAVSDQPWVLPQTGVITIQPGETKSISFTIDSSKRPDAASPIGGVTSKISLVFPTGTGTGKTALAGTPTGSASVTLVYVVAPGVTAGSPPPLGAGEVAFFVPGLAGSANASGDLLIANKQSSASVSDLKIFFRNQSVSLPQIGANAAASFPGLVKNVFSSTVPGGTTQIRGGDLSKVSVAAIQLNTSSPFGTFGTALPVLRSDRGIARGERMVVSGVSKQPGVQTDLYVQELTGNSADVRIDFVNAQGGVIGSRPAETIVGFGTLELPDAVPADAIAVRIANNSSGTAMINAFGLVQSASTGDAWVVNDPVVNGSATDDTLIFPIVSAGAGATTVFYATNRTASATSVTVDTRSVAGKRRAVPHAIAGPLAVSTSTLQPFESLFVPSVSATTAYVKVISAARAMSVNARSVRVVDGKSFGTGLPALPTSAAIASGDLKRFAGVEDSSSFSTNLILIESNNQTATVRVTLRYTFIAGATVSANAVSSKEYSVAASQFLVINDLARDVIGSQRDAFGDLHNMELDIEVSGGSGRVLPYLHTIDKGSGDMVVRTD